MRPEPNKPTTATAWEEEEEEAPAAAAGAFTNHDVPKDTKPPLVVRRCTCSPRSSGGGIGDQLHLGALANEFPRSCSSWKKEVAMARSVSSLKRIGKMACILSACRA